MKRNFILPALTIGLLGTTAFMVVDHQSETQREQPADGTQPTGQTSRDASSARTQSLLAKHSAMLMTGVSTRLPVASDFRLISEIPWQRGIVAQAFRAAGPEMSARIIEPGMPVIQPLLPAEPSTVGPLGRRSLFSIHLKYANDNATTLPAVTQGIIQDYLGAHRLTIQAVLYRNPDDQLLVAPQLRAAFVRIDSPELTTKPESMIEKSITELRTLGAYWPSTAPFAPGEMRTLVLAFRYTREDLQNQSSSGPSLDFELIFLHLLKDSASSEPQIAVFATSDGREQFHLLAPNDAEAIDQFTAINADINFSDSAILGMYPKSPVVTGVHHLSLLSIPTDLVLAQMEGITGAESNSDFSSYLDTLFEQSKQVTNQASDSNETQPAAQETPQSSEKAETVAP